MLISKVTMRDELTSRSPGWAITTRELVSVSSHFTGGEKSRWSMGCLLYSTIISITFLVSGIKQKLDEEKNKLVDEGF